MTTTPDETASDVTSADLIASLQRIIRTNYSDAATHQATTGETYQRVADVVAKAHPAMWTRLAAELPVAELADQIAASLYIQLRGLTYGTPEYAAVDDVRMHIQSLRKSNTG